VSGVRFVGDRNFAGHTIEDIAIKYYTYTTVFKSNFIECVNTDGVGSMCAGGWLITMALSTSVKSWVGGIGIRPGKRGVGSYVGFTLNPRSITMAVHVIAFFLGSISRQKSDSC